MKNKNIIKTYLGALTFIGVSLMGVGNVFAMPANPAFTDVTFYECVINSYNRRTGSSVSFDTALTDAQLNRIDVFICVDEGIDNVTGIEKLTGVRDAYLHENDLTTVDLSLVDSLKWAFLEGNQLTSLKLNTGITLLDASDNYLETLDLSRASVLNDIKLKNNPISDIDISNQPHLINLDLSGTNVDYLNTKNNAMLTVLKVDTTTMIDADITTNEEGGVYTVDISHIASNNDPYAISSEDPGFVFRSLIENTDYYTYDANTDLITITNPDRVHGYINVAGYNLLVPIGELPDDEDDELDYIVVPDTAGTTGLSAPDTGAEHKDYDDRAVFVTSVLLSVVALTFALGRILKNHLSNRISFKKYD